MEKRKKRKFVRGDGDEEGKRSSTTYEKDGRLDLRLNKLDLDPEVGKVEQKVDLNAVQKCTKFTKDPWKKNVFPASRKIENVVEMFYSITKK